MRLTVERLSCVCAESQADSHVDWLIPAILAGMIGMLMVVMVVRERRGGRRRDQPLEETVATPNGTPARVAAHEWRLPPQDAGVSNWRFETNSRLDAGSWQQHFVQVGTGAIFTRCV